MSDTPTSDTTTSGQEEQRTENQPAHKHAISEAERAVVVGKCLKPATAPNKVIEVLVDIAG